MKPEDSDKYCGLGHMKGGKEKKWDLCDGDISPTWPVGGRLRCFARSQGFEGVECWEKLCA